MRRIKRVFLGLLLSVLLLAAVAAGLMFVPSVQSFLAGKIAGVLSENIPEQVEIGGVRISPFGYVEAREALVRDHRGDTLIYLEKASADLSMISLLQGKLVLKNLRMDSPRVDIRTYRGEQESNFKKFIRIFQVENPRPLRLSCWLLEIEGGRFSLCDENRTRPRILGVDRLSARISGIGLAPEDYRFKVEDLSFGTEQDFLVKSFSCGVSLSGRRFVIDDFKLSTGRSRLSLSVNSSLGAMIGRGDVPLLERLKMFDYLIDVSDSYIFPAEFAAFDRRLAQVPGFSFSVFSRASMGNFNLERFRIRTLSSTRLALHGDLRIDPSRKWGLGDFKLLLSDFSTNRQDVSLLAERFGLKKVESFMASNRLESLTLSGISEYNNGRDLDLNFRAESASAGKISGSLSLSDVWDRQKTAYSALVGLVGVKLGQIFPERRLGATNAYLRLEGSGLDRESIDLKLDAAIRNIYAAGYNYRNINLSSSLAGGDLGVKMSVADPNLQAEIEASAYSAAEGGIDVNLEAFLDRINFHPLRMATDTIANASGNLTADLHFDSKDDFTGGVTLSQINYHNSRSLVFLDDIILSLVEDKDSTRTLTVSSSDMIDGYLKGRYDLFGIPRILTRAVKRSLNLTREEVLPEEDDQYFAFDFNLRKDLFTVFAPSVEISDNTVFSGYFSSPESCFDLNLSSDWVYIGNSRMDTIAVKMSNCSQDFNGSLSFRKYRNRYYNLEHFRIGAHSQRDTLFVDLNTHKLDVPSDSVALNLYQCFDPQGNIVAGILPSAMEIDSQRWTLYRPGDRQSNRFSYDPRTGAWSLARTGFESPSGSFYLWGEAQGKDKYEFRVDADHLDLKNLIELPVQGRIFSGVLNGGVVLSKKDAESQSVPEVRLSVNGFAMGEEPVGDVFVGASLEGGKDLLLDLRIDKDSLRTLALSGRVIDAVGKPAVSAVLQFDGFDPDPIRVMIPQIFSRMKGSVSGRLDVTGSPSNPLIDGDLRLDKTVLRVAYTNVGYRLAENTVVPVRRSYFYFNDVHISDELYGTPARINGRIYHDNFKKWALDLRFDLDRTLAMNTDEDLNEAFYGKIFATGYVTLKGLTNALAFDIAARTEKGTTFDIPISSTAQAQNSGFIEFVPPPSQEEEVDERLAALTKVREKKESNLNLNIRAQVTSDALIQVILDETVGDILKGTGDGPLSIRVAPNNVFTMNGVYTVTGGDYLFTLKNIINKKFQIEPGGTITWEGSPENPILDLYATYKLQTNPSSYLQSSAKNRKEEVVLRIHLTNTLSNPEFTYEITMPRAQENVKSELAYKLSEADQLDQQFISLIAFNTFSNTGANSNLIASGVAGSTIEVLSNQLSNIVSDLVDGLDINVSLGSALTQSPGINERTDLEVALSHKLFNDRVTVNGVVGVPVNSSQSDLVGDVEVEIDITSDGKLKGIVFNRRAPNDYITNQLSYMQGLGFSYRQEFDTFSELMRKIFTRNNQRIKERLARREERRRQHSADNSSVDTPPVIQSVGK